MGFRPRVAVLGTGRMGSALARLLHRKGYDLVVWNRTREKAERLAKDLEIMVAESPVRAIEGVEVAMALLADDDALYQVLSSLRRMDGLLFINMGTHTPRAARYASTYVTGNGGCYIESPIVAGPKALESEKAILIVGGERHCVAQARSLLEDIGREGILYVGEDPGAAQALKLAFNSLLITTVSSLAQSVRLVEDYGLDRSLLKELLSKTVFRGVAEKYIDRMTRPLEDPASFRAELAAKDLKYAIDAGYDTGLPLPLTLAALSLYLSIPKDRRDIDYTKVYHFIKR